MIEYITATNIDDRVLKKAAILLQEGGLVAFLTDTSWAVACALSSKIGIKKLKSLSPERNERHFTLICATISQIGQFCSLSNRHFRLIKRLTPGPYVFILPTLLGTEKALNIKRKEIGVRIPDYPVSTALIHELNEPLYSITAKRSMVQDTVNDTFEESDGTATSSSILEEDLFEGGWELEAIENIDLILDTGEDHPRLYSTVLDLTDEAIQVLRYGAGEWPVNF